MVEELGLMSEDFATLEMLSKKLIECSTLAFAGSHHLQHNTQYVTLFLINMVSLEDEDGWKDHWASIMVICI